jgi:hypothetical protein
VSKLEEALAEQFRIAARDLNRPWAWSSPVAQHHPDWCCECKKPQHGWRGLGSKATAWCRGCETAHVYLKGRDWAIDFAFLPERVAVEVEGIVYARKGASVGRHQTGAGMEADLEKYGWLQAHRWTVVRVSRKQITSGEALRLIETMLRQAVTA